MTCVCLQEDVSIKGARVVGCPGCYNYSAVCLEKDGKRYILITLVDEEEPEINTYLFGSDCEHPGTILDKPLICCEEKGRLCKAALDAASRCWEEEVKKA